MDAPQIARVFSWLLNSLIILENQVLTKDDN